MSLNALQPCKPQFLYDRLGHAPCVNEDQRGRVGFDEFLDDIYVVVEEFFHRDGCKSGRGQ